MRLWHKDLIKVLPRQQLISQWRECCAIAGRLAKDGTPNHLLVNKILDYDIDEFVYYTKCVISELEIRGYKITKEAWDRFFNNIVRYSGRKKFKIIPNNEIFLGWHNRLYLSICYMNLYEKWFCGGITNDEWLPIMKKMVEIETEEMKWREVH